MLQADMLQADTRATPCSQPLQQRAYATAAPWLMEYVASVTHSYLSCALYSSMIMQDIIEIADLTQRHNGIIV